MEVRHSTLYNLIPRIFNSENLNVFYILHHMRHASDSDIRLINLAYKLLHKVNIYIHDVL